jgi:hypothetical protein
VFVGENFRYLGPFTDAVCVKQRTEVRSTTL